MAIVKILSFADNDSTTDAENVNTAMAKEEGVSLFVHVGDGPYSDEGKTWSDMMKKTFDDVRVKLFRISRGNHDCNASESDQTQKDIATWLGLPTEGNWLKAEQTGNVYNIIMDSEDLDIEFQRDQYNFVKAEIDKAKALRAAGQIDWICAYVHKPWFTLKSTASPYTAVRRIYNDMFLEAQVDFVLHGHNHNAQYWFPMEVDFAEEANGLGKQLFTQLPDKTFDFSKRHGWAGIVTGHAGHEWNAIKDTGEGVKNVMFYNDGVKGGNKFGYTSIEFDGKKAHVMAKDTDNAIIFEYKVTREGGTTPPPPPPPVDPICPPGQHLENHMCVPDVVIPPGTDPEPSCPPGYTFSKATCTCVKDDPDPQQCKPNWYFNQELKRCIPKLIPDDDTQPLGVDARFPSSQKKAKAGDLVILDGSSSIAAGNNITWTILQADTDVAKVALVDVPGKNYSKGFQMPDTAEVLDFALTISNATSSDVANVMVQREDVIVPPPPPPGPGGVDAFGMKMLFKPTANKVAMEKGTDHENGQRYNVNHMFHNYIQQGYYKLGSGQAKINHKGDGPNHGGCKSKPNCLWYEMDIALSGGKFMLQYEMPHPDNFDVSDDKCELVKSVGDLAEGAWIGWATAYYWGPDGKRHMKAFVDKNPFGPDGKPLNNWEEGLFAIEKGQIVTDITHPRDIQAMLDHEAGAESEIRMHGATSGDTEMKNAWVFELEPQGTPKAMRGPR